MDFDILKNDFLKPLITLIIPGFVAIHSFLFLLLLYLSHGTENTILGIDWDSFKSIFVENGEISLSSTTVIFFILVILSLFIGVILEDLGSWIELGCRNLLTKSRFENNEMILAHRASNILLCLSVPIFLFSLVTRFVKPFIHDEPLLLDIKYTSIISFVLIVIAILLKFHNLFIKSILSTITVVSLIIVWYEIVSNLDSITGKEIIIILAIIPIFLFIFFICIEFTSRKENVSTSVKDSFKEDWKSYLNIKEDKEKIGVKYIRQIITRFKFELSMIWASFISALSYYQQQKEICWFFLLLSSYLLFESYYSVVVLYKTRHALVNYDPEEGDDSKPISVNVDCSIGNR